MSAEPAAVSGQPTLKRSLRYWDLVLYGLILVQPTAPMPVFGVIYKQSDGFAVSAVLCALVAMLFTSISYGRMSRRYTEGGSAYTYVGRELHPALGYMAGWCMALDYILNPLICTIWCAKAAGNFVPGVPYVAWAIFFALLFTTLNLNGVETSARINTMMATALFVVVALVIVVFLRYILHMDDSSASFYTDPFYNHTFTSSALFRRTSIAVLAYIGFDGISTLSDE